MSEYQFDEATITTEQVTIESLLLELEDVIRDEGPCGCVESRLLAYITDLDRGHHHTNDGVTHLGPCSTLDQIAFLLPTGANCAHDF